MPFAKDFFDVGLFTNQAEAVRAFYSGLGLSFDHTLKLGGGVLQHRYQADEAVLKINDPECRSPTTSVDPDGNRVTCVPVGYEGNEGLTVRLSVTSPNSSRTFYMDALGLTEDSPGVLRCGRARLRLEESGQPPAAKAPLAATGLRYLTFQVFDCDAAYARAIQAGAVSGRAPVTLGNTARIAFVYDPDGTWIELSERASVTGKAV